MDKTTELFCLIDDFCQQFEPLLKQGARGNGAALADGGCGVKPGLVYAVNPRLSRYSMGSILGGIQQADVQCLTTWRFHLRG